MSTTPPTEGTVKKSRAPRKDYGYAVDSTIKVIRKEGEAPSYRGQRAKWFERVVNSEGSTVSDFVKAHAGEDSPRGWLRFFANDQTIKLVKKEG